MRVLSRRQGFRRSDFRRLIESEANTHPLSDLSGDLSPNRGNDSRSLSQFRGLESGTADLSGGIHLSNVNLFVSSQFGLIALFDTATRLSRTTLITAYRLTSTGIDARNLCTHADQLANGGLSNQGLTKLLSTW
jgi:hypothetical protein